MFGIEIKTSDKVFCLNKIPIPREYHFTINDMNDFYEFIKNVKNILNNDENTRVNIDISELLKEHESFRKPQTISEMKLDRMIKDAAYDFYEKNIEDINDYADEIVILFKNENVNATKEEVVKRILEYFKFIYLEHLIPTQFWGEEYHIKYWLSEKN